jgi:hypothetical protein
MLRVLTVSLVLAALTWPSVGAGAQHQAACDREHTTAIQFGHTAGNLVPETIEVTRNGTVRRLDDEHRATVLGHVPRDSVLALARRAWRGGFAALPPAPGRPTANPDAARPYIELHSACGLKHVEYGPGTESPLFKELFARLTRLTKPVVAARRQAGR